MATREEDYFWSLALAHLEGSVQVSSVDRTVEAREYRTGFGGQDDWPRTHHRMEPDRWDARVYSTQLIVYPMNEALRMIRDRLGPLSRTRPIHTDPMPGPAAPSDAVREALDRIAQSMTIDTTVTVPMDAPAAALSRPIVTTRETDPPPADTNDGGDGNADDPFGDDISARYSMMEMD